ncbi:hypothetical protein HOU52_gp50 [Arthrobacter phage Yang]|uniref:Uncharacterized protein n=1 Tax=Arthrobacter phage Yang TaxID=2419970 RepID=A0A3G2KJD9_9CAUD|nr:hypothetical protein HOU52_gp50 [Arthrobacter phage Yang]AYN59135.1 hypothetical protein PBI_YANG_50 [Arthrobacter phage Yang]
MATRTKAEHRARAEELLALSKTYPHQSAARLAALAEAQVEAVLSLPTADDFGTPASPEVDSALIGATLAQDAPKAPRRTRKAPSAKEEA